MEGKALLCTAVVEGPLALRMRRVAAARGDECGLQIFSLLQLAARLAGGFAHPIAPDILEPAIQHALGEKAFREIERVSELPGITRAIAGTLQKVWNADIDLSAAASNGTPRLLDLATIEQRVRSRLPSAMLLPRDLRTAALARVDRAPVLLGPVRLEKLTWIEPLWRPLLNALCKIVPSIRNSCVNRFVHAT